MASIAPFPSTRDALIARLHYAAEAHLRTHPPTESAIQEFIDELFPFGSAAVEITLLRSGDEYQIELFQTESGECRHVKASAESTEWTRFWRQE
jgi:hypothetical protein